MELCEGELCPFDPQTLKFDNYRVLKYDSNQKLVLNTFKKNIIDEQILKNYFQMILEGLL